jgi:nuclear protein localization family protein 4
MSKAKAILLRVQSPEGTKRIEVSASDTTCRLFERVHDTFDLSSFAFALYKERNQKNEITSSKTRSVASAGLRHGDMIYLLPLNGAVLFPSTSVSLTNRYSTKGC